MSLSTQLRWGRASGVPSSLGRSKGLAHLISIILTTILGGLLTAALVRNSPGFDSDERLLDPRLDSASIAAIHAEHAASHDILHLFGRMLHGDFGVSPSLNRPISELLAARLPATLRLMGVGIAVAWAASLAFAIAAVTGRSRILARAAATASAGALCVPSAVVAILVFALGGPVMAVIPLVLFPRIFENVRNLLANAYERPHILTARAKGVSTTGILLRHALPVCAPELLALAGVSAIMAFGAAIPVETVCDIPGLGQLAWKAATARDLPLLVTLTLIIAILTQVVNAASDWLTPEAA
jgi:peptide/nickel transport system permease protein